VRRLHPAALSTLVATLALTALTACAGCDEQAAAAGPPDSGPAPTPTAAPTQAPAPSASSSPGAEGGELKVLKLQFTSEVKKKEPIDKLEAAQPGQRVWAHVTARNRTDATKPITLAFLVGGSERAKIDLTVDPSWSYRTWGYVTLRAGDTGEVVAEVRDDRGTVMERARIPIKKE
jgi:hypothetical protein